MHQATYASKTNQAPSQTEASRVGSTSSIVRFDNESEKVRFLSVNGLDQSDLVPRPLIDAYVVDRVPGSLIPSGATVSPRIKYHASTYGLTGDPDGASQWGLATSRFLAAWKRSAGQGQLVAVIDTGFALNQEDLANKWFVSLTETSDSTVDRDGSGLAGDWRGWDFLNQDNDPQTGTNFIDGAGVTHGSMVAGIIGSQGGNGLGGIGGAPDVRILPLQALDDDGSGYTDILATAVHYAADKGSRVINLSLGATQPDALLREQVDYAIAKGSVVVAAAGNDGCDCLLYPAAYPEVVAVGAVNQSGVRASFSSFGSELDLVAAGVNVCSTSWTPSNPTGSYACGSGTSYSAPMASATLVLIAAAYPLASSGDLITYLKSGAIKLSAMSGLARTDAYGNGLLNAESSLLLPALLHGGSNPVQTVERDAGHNRISVCLSDPGVVCSLSAVSATTTSPLGSQISDANGIALIYWQDTTNDGSPTRPILVRKT